MAKKKAEVKKNGVDDPNRMANITLTYDPKTGKLTGDINGYEDELTHMIYMAMVRDNNMPNAVSRAMKTYVNYLIIRTNNGLNKLASNLKNSIKKEKSNGTKKQTVSVRSTVAPNRKAKERRRKK